MQQEYVLYKGDELIGVGTLQELEACTDIRASYIKFCSYPSYQKRVEKLKRPLLAFKIEEEEK